MLDKISNMAGQTDLGKFIELARKHKNLSLRDVQEQTDISNAYLSQLEKGKIKQPSPLVLHKLSEIYEVSYAELMQLSGYPVPNASEEITETGFSSRVGPITKDEEDELLAYLEFIRAKRRRG